MPVSEQRKMEIIEEEKIRAGARQKFQLDDLFNRLKNPRIRFFLIVGILLGTLPGFLRRWNTHMAEAGNVETRSLLIQSTEGGSQ